MKLIVNKRNECCESVTLELTTKEALVLNHAMRVYVDDDSVHDDSRRVMNQMLSVKPEFREIESCPLLERIRADLIELKIVVLEDDYDHGYNDGLNEAIDVIDYYND